MKSDLYIVKMSNKLLILKCLNRPWKLIWAPILIVFVKKTAYFLYLPFLYRCAGSYLGCFLKNELNFFVQSCRWRW